jgi:predicted RNase H-like HicB family nuclease
VKNQYFGDVKDYFKYGLLRCYAASGLQLGVHWLLTRDDGSNDGRNRKYLQDASWREPDPELYDFLQAVTQKPSGLMVSNLETSGLLPARYFSEVIPEAAAERLSAFERAGQELAGSHLLFLDPDIGIEVRSVQYGSRGSSRYVFWSEIQAAWGSGVSLLIYQHYPRQNHETFTAQMAAELASHTPGASIHTLATQDVVFLLAAQPPHEPYVQYAHELATERWGRNFRITKHEGAAQAQAATPAPPQAPPKYHIDVFWSQRDNCWVASVPDLQGCIVGAATPQQALAAVIADQERWLEEARTKGAPYPEARSYLRS